MLRFPPVLFYISRIVQDQLFITLYKSVRFQPELNANLAVAAIQWVAMVCAGGWQLRAGV